MPTNAVNTSKIKKKQGEIRIW